MDFKIALQGLLPAIPATASVRYVLHRDVSGNQWNVFKKTGFYEDFVKSFTELSAAQGFCNINNGVVDAMKGKA